jgi:transcriptional regulator with GAF, ATPase, and Fis domain/RNase P/RNase MRP subunit p29
VPKSLWYDWRAVVPPGAVRPKENFFVKTNDGLAGRAVTGRSRVLTISHRNRVRVVPLPATGQVSLGRGEECDVQISGDPLISRRHARLHVGELVLVEDEGSQNGTRVLGGRRDDDASEPTASSPERLPPRRPTPLAEGATVQLGSTLLSIEETSAGAGPGATVVGDVVVADPRMRHLHALLERVAGRDINVLLLGETGAGKDVFARRIHALSPRARAPFFGINCGALSESLLESELFGHVKGAFTGASQAKPGLFEAASGGVAFLDEVGELSPNLQVKLLRVLEDRTVLRVGAVRPTPIDVRIVAATNRDLDRAVAAGQFRSDLYYRLDGISFVIPPLRERKGEVLPLAALWLRRFCEKEGRREVPALSNEAAEKLYAYDWPGNVRELRNVIERALVLCDGPAVRAEHVVLTSAARYAPARPSGPVVAGGEGDVPPPAFVPPTDAYPSAAAFPASPSALPTGAYPSAAAFPPPAPAQPTGAYPSAAALFPPFPAAGDLAPAMAPSPPGPFSGGPGGNAAPTTFPPPLGSPPGAWPLPLSATGPFPGPSPLRAPSGTYPSAAHAGFGGPPVAVDALGPDAGASPASPEGLRSQADELEREHLRAALDACAGNQTRAAALLGISRRALIRRIERFQLARPKKRNDE